ncbi:DUF2612 domain-containing protein [Nguyenibacter vanlangensis]|uniref:DUF2612 domain-containing protein n=1 Tax=Nguyenibacter vanlangensis TaxID=1216886 RepID=A0A7Y7M5B3_9PROT|nr:DUF2612 domain-containing protein [Nguyenibacter vanlangensis]NVN09699.1 DUF2612 domain-containing protein [Nguyenibacter vanlangensis]
MDNVQQTIISQYANSPTINALIEAWNQSIDPSSDIQNFYDLIWNVQTATGYGLDVWGRIVGVGRVLQVANTSYIGFAQQSPTVTTFGSGILYSGGATTGNYSLTDDAYRQLIMAKAAANITNGSITSINAILAILFSGRGACYVADSGNMTMTYVFEFVLTPVDVSVVVTSGILPRPAGVQISYRQTATGTTLDNDFYLDVSPMS